MQDKEIEKILKDREKNNREWEIAKSVVLKAKGGKYNEKVAVMTGMDDILKNGVYRREELIYFNKIMDTIKKFNKKLPRYVCEYNIQYRQLVSQFIIKDKYDRYLFVRKLNKGTETRLHGSIGLVGGHINDLNHMVDELYEETDIRDIGEDIEPIGIIKMLEYPEVEAEHMGIVYEVEIGNILNLCVPEAEIDTIDYLFLEKDQLGEYVDEFDKWTKWVYDKFIKED